MMKSLFTLFFSNYYRYIIPLYVQSITVTFQKFTVNTHTNSIKSAMVGPSLLRKSYIIQMCIFIFCSSFALYSSLFVYVEQ